ncbi:hypothetical protein SynROS8604_03425 [Synechococcus sp. ROS8604]|nr:hypothetical protein SynROS8604_03425 [Synechococcus sp. ROS8604]
MKAFVWKRLFADIGLEAMDDGCWMKASREPCFARPVQFKTMLNAIFLLWG